jgi:DNA-binding cell septation regulator SpoVG
MKAGSNPALPKERAISDSHQYIHTIMNTEQRINRFKELWKEYKYLEDALGWLQDEIPEGEFLPDWTKTVELDESRWMIHTLEVIEIDEGVFVGVRWERGKTEMQENLYEDDDVYHIEPVEVTKIEWRAGERL